jgi:hypothetical protein
MADTTKEHDYSEYIVYGDETGDQSTKSIYDEHPVFALTLCIFSKRDYIEHVVKGFKELKFNFWGHDAIILHGAKLRRQIEDFQFLQNEIRREIFLYELNKTIQNSPFTVISTAIDKRLLKEMRSDLINAYELSLEYCMDSVYRFLHEKNQPGKVTHITIESRGSNFDNELNISFRKIIEKNINRQNIFPLKIIFVDKKANSIGLQIADLVAHPIGRYVANQGNKSRAFDIIVEKFYGFPNYRGTGLEIFPSQELIISSEKTKSPGFLRGSSAD